MEKLTGTTRISVSGVPAGMSVSLSVGGVGVGIVVGMAVSVLVGCVPLGMSVGGARKRAKTPHNLSCHGRRRSNTQIFHN
jgi:hypothetical protein